MPLETRSAMAYWQNGKLYLHCSTQSVAQTVEMAAQWVGVEPADVVVISEYTGGGFGSKIPGAHSMAIPALLAKKTGLPVMMRISREEELFIGRARPGLLARVKAGFRADGRLAAVDLFIVQDNGPYEKQWRPRLGREHLLAGLPTRGDALPRHLGADQHPAAHLPAIAGRHAAERDHGADPRESRSAAADRSGRHPSDQRALGPGAVRRRRREGTAQPRHQRVRAGGAGQGREGFRLGRPARRAAVSDAARRCAASASR